MREEWFVLAQTALMLAVLGRPETGWTERLPVQDKRRRRRPALHRRLGIRRARIDCPRPQLIAVPQAKREGTLVESGIFSVVRHPIYSGLSLAAFGWSLIWKSIAALVVALLLLAFFEIKARREERWLEEKFPGYAPYKSRARKLIPFVY